jgi:hypothetical protein
MVVIAERACLVFTTERIVSACQHAITYLRACCAPRCCAACVIHGWHADLVLPATHLLHRGWGECRGGRGGDVERDRDCQVGNVRCVGRLDGLITQWVIPPIRLLWKFTGRLSLIITVVLYRTGLTAQEKKKVWQRALLSSSFAKPAKNSGFANSSS